MKSKIIIPIIAGIILGSLSILGCCLISKSINECFEEFEL